MIHGFGDEGHAGHVAERRVEVLALVGFVQLAVHGAPAGHSAEKLVDFLVRESTCRHVSLPDFPPALRLSVSREDLWPQGHYESAPQGCQWYGRPAGLGPAGG